MPYQKPTVTIELKEYQDLLDFKERFKHLRLSDYELALRLVMQDLYLNNRSSQSIISQRVKNELANNNLVMVIGSQTSNETIYVDIKKIV